jgi:hypothetical protein
MKKLATNTGVLMLAIIAVSGVSILLNIDAFYATTEDKSKAYSGPLLVSNIEVVKKDAAGNIIAYRQGGNHITASGMEIIARQVFGPGANPVVGSPQGDEGPTVSNNTNYTGPSGEGGWGGRVQWMEIGNGTGSSDAVGGRDCATLGGGPDLGWNNETLECPISVVQTCPRVKAVIHRFNATVDPSPSDPSDPAAQINMTAVATFAGAVGQANGCDTSNIGEAGIWTNATAGPQFFDLREQGNNMFARNTFGTVNLSDSDSLELTWKFTFTDS